MHTSYIYKYINATHTYINIHTLICMHMHTFMHMYMYVCIVLSVSEIILYNWVANFSKGEADNIRLNIKHLTTIN